MPKQKTPLFSFQAHGTIGKFLTFVRRRGQNISEAKPEVPDAKTLAQLSWRHMFLKVVALWHALTPQEQAEWESLARQRHLTGYQWFVSQALRPNPGIYLPLQGGTMQGNIDMAGHKVEDLPDPAADQEPVTRKYLEDNLPAGGYTAGARVKATAHQTIPHNIDTIVTWDAEDFDTDAIHDNVTDNTRLTCKTAGKYLIGGTVLWEGNATGRRIASLKLNGVTVISDANLSLVGADATSFAFLTLYDLAITNYVEMQVYQTSGGDLTLRKTQSNHSRFWMQRIG